MEDFQSVLVLGGAGFIGRHVIAKLAETTWRVVVATRHYEDAKHLIQLPPVDDVIEADVHDDAALDRLMYGQDAVINLIGILHSSPGTPYGDDFAKVHVELPRRIANACAANGVRRLLHVSALGADRNGPSMYLRSKADGEAAARSRPEVDVTIFRPAVVFGEDDNFLNLFASLEKHLPVMLLAAPDARFQPVFVQDVAQAIVHALIDERTIRKTYELAGPNIYTLRELVTLAGEYSAHPRPVIGITGALARLQATVMEYLPGTPLMTRDNLDSMKVDNVATGPIAPELGIIPTPLEAVAPYYLGGSPKPHTGVEAARNPAR